MSKWIEYQPVLDELKHEWCNKCNKTCPYNNCKIYRVMQILSRQKPIPHETEKGDFTHAIYSHLSLMLYKVHFAEASGHWSVFQRPLGAAQRPAITKLLSVQ